MANKYIANSSGALIEVEGLQTSAGAGDAGKIPALNSSGEVDITMIPSSVGATTFSATAGETLTAGDWVNLYNDTGLKMRKADATDATKPAHGFVLDNVTSAASGAFYYAGINSAVSGLTVAAEYFLATTAGAEVATAPSSTGNIVQSLGTAKSATEVIVNLSRPVTLA